VGEDKSRLTAELKNVLDGKGKKGIIPPLWDGHTGDRIADILCRM
jgi:UDP-N-acetylglucosamine 2-epimerase (non-hydrolysing)